MGLASFCVLGGLIMIGCKFECIYLSELGECKNGGGECQKESCLDFDDCESCRRYDDCEEQ